MEPSIDVAKPLFILCTNIPSHTVTDCAICSNLPRWDVSELYILDMHQGRPQKELQFHICAKVHTWNPVQLLVQNLVWYNSATDHYIHFQHLQLQLQCGPSKAVTDYAICSIPTRVAHMPAAVHIYCIPQMRESLRFLS